MLYILNILFEYVAIIIILHHLQLNSLYFKINFDFIITNLIHGLKRP